MPPSRFAISALSLAVMRRISAIAAGGCFSESRATVLLIADGYCR